MSSTALRRMRRKKQQDIKKGRYKEPVLGPELEIPTEKDVEEYILNKTKELRTQIKIESNV